MSATKTIQASENLGLSVVTNNGDGTGSFDVNVVASVAPTGSATAANQTTQITAEQAIQATLGATSGAAVITDANGTIQQYLRGLITLMIGVITTVTGSTVTATNVSGTACAANANRKSAVIVNNGAEDVTIRRGTPAVAGSGIILKANGGAYEINSTNLYKGIITCITASGSSALGIEEGV